jgi:NADH:ubiquinone oxidoreductase subunit 2 (subunit N)
VLIISSALNAMYFLPILHTAWFREPAGQWPQDRKLGRWETHWMLLAPTVAAAALSLAAGVLANAPFSPLEWARFIVARQYGQ